jgi:hypothetical protein
VLLQYSYNIPIKILIIIDIKGLLTKKKLIYDSDSQTTMERIMDGGELENLFENFMIGMFLCLL